MRTVEVRRRLFLTALAAVALLACAAPAAAVTAPQLASPAGGATLSYLPTFAWNGVTGADKYEFEIATDSGFNSPIRVDGRDSVFTKNTRATLKKSVPN